MLISRDFDFSTWFERYRQEGRLQLPEQLVGPYSDVARRCWEVLCAVAFPGDFAGVRYSYTQWADSTAGGLPVPYPEYAFKVAPLFGPVADAITDAADSVCGVFLTASGEVMTPEAWTQAKTKGETIFGQFFSRCPIQLSCSVELAFDAVALLNKMRTCPAEKIDLCLLRSAEFLEIVSVDEVQKRTACKAGASAGLVEWQPKKKTGRPGVMDNPKHRAALREICIDPRSTIDDQMQSFRRYLLSCGVRLSFERCRKLVQAMRRELGKGRGF